MAPSFCTQFTHGEAIVMKKDRSAETVVTIGSRMTAHLEIAGLRYLSAQRIIPVVSGSKNRINMPCPRAIGSTVVALQAGGCQQ